MDRQRWTAFLVVVLILMTWGGVFKAPQGAAQEPRPQPGGTLRVATIGEPPSLDQQWTTAFGTLEIMMHVYETLFALDSSYRPVPMLATGYTVSSDGLTYTIALRSDVVFHNGKPMTSEDVVASLLRWGRVQALGRALFGYVTSLNAIATHTVEFRLKRPNATLPYALARIGGAATIHPKEVVDEAGDGQIRRFVGTGPYRFVERIPDRHIKLARFGEYRARTEPADGWAGRKMAYLDEILFIPTPESSARIAGVETGEFDVADQVPPDAHARLRTVPGLQHFFGPWAWTAPFLNHKSGPFRDRRIRQAYQLVLRAEPIMRGAFGDAAFYNIDASLMPKHTAWWTEDGCKQWYNQGNTARARDLLREAGYKGEPIVFLTTQEYFWAYNTALVTRQLMQNAGFVVNLTVLDWATIVRLRTDPKNWHMHSSSHTAWGEPTGYSVLNPEFVGWWENARKDSLVDRMRSQRDHADRMATWKQLQALWCEEAALPKHADANVYRVARARVQGMPNLQVVPYWNAWIRR